MKRILAYMILVLLVMACQTKSYIVPDMEQEMTIEGWIENGSFPVVILSKTMLADGKWHPIDEFEEYAIGDAKVTVNDGEKDYPLFKVQIEERDETGLKVTVNDGEQDHSLFIHGVEIGKNIPPFIYTTPFLLGEVGKTYTVKAEADGHTITGSSTLLEPTPILEARAEKVTDVENDDRYKIVIKFNDNPGEDNYYKTFVLVEGEDQAFAPSLLGNKDDKKIDGECEMSIYKSFTIPISKFQAYFRKGDKVFVRLCAVDEVAFQYWDTLEELTIFSRNIFFPTTSRIPSTVKGGQGYWCAYGCSYISLEI